MINLEIVEFVKRHLQAGESQEKVRNDLLSNGWNDADINEAMTSIAPQSTVPTIGQILLVKKSSKMIPVIISLVVLVLLGGGGVFAYKVYKDKSTKKINENESVESALVTTQSVKTQSVL